MFWIFRHFRPLFLYDRWTHERVERVGNDMQQAPKWHFIWLKLTVVCCTFLEELDLQPVKCKGPRKSRLHNMYNATVKYSAVMRLCKAPFLWKHATGSDKDVKESYYISGAGVYKIHWKWFGASARVVNQGDENFTIHQNQIIYIVYRIYVFYIVYNWLSVGFLATFARGM